MSIFASFKDGNYYLHDFNYMALSTIVPGFDEKLINVIDTEDTDDLARKIAEIVYIIFEECYLCSEKNKKAEWYIFKNHHWENIDEILVEKNISKNIKEFCQKYKFMLDVKQYELHNKRLHPIPDISAIEILNQRIEKLDKIIYAIGSITFSKKIYKECIILFFDQEFKLNCDTKPLLCFTNGVLDLNTGEFRPGKFSDYCTISCSYDFISEEDKKEDFRLNKFLEEIFPNPEMRNRFLTQICHCIFKMHLYKSPLQEVGDSERINFSTFFTNRDRSGLSTVIHFLKKCFEEYCIQVPHIDSEKSAHHSLFESSPSLFERFSKRKILFLSETNLEKTIETISSLEEVPGKFIVAIRKFDFESVPDQNHLKIFPRVEFESVFVSEIDKNFAVPVDRESQVLNKTFHCNPHITEELSDLKSAFIRLLLQHRMKILK